MSERSRGGKVPRASVRMRRTVSLPASMSTPAALYSLTVSASPRRFEDPSEVELVDERLHQRPARRLVGRLPVGAAREGEKALLVEILLEHVEPFGDQGDRLTAV